MTYTRADYVRVVAAAQRREAVRRALLAELHDRQRAVVESPATRKAVLCGRRSGKTEMDARYLAAELEKCGPEEWCIYSAVTRSLGKDLIWGKLTEVKERHGLRWKMYGPEGRIVTHRSGQFRVLGFDKLPELQKTRGYKLRSAVFDEPATYEDRLEELLRDCVGPALTDLRGTVLVNGTPGPVCRGFWHDISTGGADDAGRRRGASWARFRWNVLHNPLFPRDAAEMLREEREANGWTEESTTYRREYLGEWVNDLDALVYAYVEARNAVQELPADYDRETWIHTLGIDYGYHPDPCAWVVLASHPRRREIFVVHAEVHTELLPDEAAEITRRLVDHFRPVRVVGDAGGSGKAYVEQWNRRYADAAKIWVQPAQKEDKKGAIDLLNGELRAERYTLVLDGCRAYASEIAYLPWLDDQRKHEHPAYSNHCCDAALYAFREHRSYWHVPEAAPPPPQDVRPGLEERQRRVRERSQRDWDEPF